MQDKYVCKHCRKTIDHVLYIENGKLNFPDGKRTGGDMDIGEQILLCPECNEGIKYTELRDAGALLSEIYEEPFLRENGKQCQICSEYVPTVKSWEGFTKICDICKETMEEAISNIKPEEWTCWTLSTDDIIGIAKRKGISLAGKDIDDIARRVKKAIQWSLDEQWESIVADSIRDSRAE